MARRGSWMLSKFGSASIMNDGSNLVLGLVMTIQIKCSYLRCSHLIFLHAFGSEKNARSAKNATSRDLPT
eukprot:scaffold27284_cov67-Skeletonema_dohrnii-CCMP3373.AAC.3